LAVVVFAGFAPVDLKCEPCKPSHEQSDNALSLNFRFIGLIVVDFSILPLKFWLVKEEEEERVLIFIPLNFD